MIKKLLSIIFLLVLFSLSAGKALAVQGDLGAYPTNYDPDNPKTKSWFIYELKPGETKEDSISVVNNSTKTLTVKVYAVDATTTNDGAFALLNENEKQREVGSWVSLSKNMVTVPPLDRVNVPFTIRIPQNTTVGDHPGGIIVQEVTKPNASSQGMAINIVSRVGTRIYETVPGTQIISMDVKDLTYKIVDDHLVFTFTMVNNGNIILNPEGNLAIKDHAGKTLDTISLGTLGSVFPNKPTNITVTSHIPAPFFGQYTATVTINYSPLKSIQKSLAFFIYVKNWTVAAGTGVIIVLLIILLILFRKIFHHTHTVRAIHKRRNEFWDDENEKQQDVLEEHDEKHHKQNSKPVHTAKPIHPQPARAEIPEEYVDQLFIAHHMKLLVILVCFTILIFSTLFALILQQFVLSRAETKTQQPATQQSYAPSHPPTTSTSSTSTPTPTPTNIPVPKSDIKVIVLNGTGKTGAARTVANKLTTDGFTVIKTDNAPEDATLTTIKYPQGKVDGADQLANELKPEYTEIKEVESTDPSEFTITLGEE